MLNVLVFALLMTAIPSAPPTPPAIPRATPGVAALISTPASVAMHPRAVATVRIAGAVAPIAVTVRGIDARAAVDQTTQAISVTAGEEPGAGVLHIVDANGNTLDVPLLIGPDAATIPSTLDLHVTGNPVDPVWLAQQIEAAIVRATTLVPGAALQVAPIPSPPALQPGEQSVVDVPVTATGNGALDVAATIAVQVTNVALDPVAPQFLFYDDDPEHLAGDGVAYRGTITKSAPVRLYFYHDDVEDTHRVAVLLQNAGLEKTSVQVIDATAGPNIDVLSVGHAVARDFLVRKGRNEGVIYDIAPGGTLLLHDVPANYRQVVAGSIGFNIVRGGPLTVTVLSASPGDALTTLLDGPMLPHDGHHRTGVFAITNFGTTSLSYAVGGPDVSSTFGSKSSTPPNVDPASTGRDYGDYGVVHTFLFSLSNPTPNASNVYLYERPAGGVARASFLVDGSLVDVGCVRLPSERYQIAAFNLLPGQHYLLNVQTMTEGGSNYPLEVGMTMTPPQPSAPPMSAPDGCFPKASPAP